MRTGAGGHAQGGGSHPTAPWQLVTVPEAPTQGPSCSLDCGRNAPPNPHSTECCWPRGAGLLAEPLAGILLPHTEKFKDGDKKGDEEDPVWNPASSTVCYGPELSPHGDILYLI